MDERIVWVDKVDPRIATAVAGSKIGRLSELHSAGLRVPQGFAVTVHAFRTHCRTSGLDGRIDDTVRGLGEAPEHAAVERASAELREMFEQTPVADDLAAAVAIAYEELCLRRVEINTPTAVRSSATGEDAADASFAGIFDTYLGVSGTEPILAAMRACWGSLFTARALAYRLRKGISHLAMPIAVGVIELIPARASGVAFSVHPVTGKTDRIVLETNWGWGEALVQGLVVPDRVEVGKSDGRVLQYHVAHKAVVSAFDFAAGRVAQMAMPARLADRRVLDDEEIGAVVDAVRRIEQHYGWPVDVEWALDRHRRAGEPIFVVQARPVTIPVDPAAQTPACYDPVAMALKHVFGITAVPGR
jgi:pyruvate,water dikinase